MRGKSKSIVFPASRIKRIMRINEEVGKIAVPTPILVSKALQLMLQDFLTSCCETARKHETAVVTPYLMELCMRTYDRFSFLLKLLANKQNVQFEPLESTKGLASPYSQLDIVVRYSKEKSSSRKRRRSTIAQSDGQGHRPVLSFRDQNFKPGEPYCLDMFPKPVFSLKAETEQDEYDCEESESRSSNTSYSMNDRSIVDDSNLSTNNYTSTESKHEECVSTEGHSRALFSEACPSEQKDMLCLAMVNDSSISMTRSSFGLSQNNVYSLDVTSSSSGRVMISIDELVHSEH
jgi:hypothetical protein